MIQIFILTSDKLDVIVVGLDEYLLNNVKLDLEGSKRNPVANVERLKPFTGLMANEAKNIVKIIEKLRSQNFDTKRFESRYVVEFNDGHTEWVPTDMVPAELCIEFEQNV